MAEKKKSKESVLKPIGRFVANELLGVDDAKRAVKYVKKGQFKKAAKSAATAVLEAGTTVTGAGLGAKLGAKAGLVAGKKVARSGAIRTGRTAMANAEARLPIPKRGAPGSKTKTVKADSAKPVTVTRSVNKTKVVTTSPKKVTYTTAKRTESQMAGSKKAQETRRSKEIGKAGQYAAQASYSSSRAPGAGKAVGKRTGAVTGVAAVASTKKVEKPAPKKKK